MSGIMVGDGDRLIIRTGLQGTVQIDLSVEIVPEPPAAAWAFPVGEGIYPPARWYAASLHTPNGSSRHIGIDLNLDVSPWGDIERTLGLSIFAISAGMVVYYTANWSGVPTIVVEHEHHGAPLWVRYAHITPVVRLGERIAAGQRLGGFADWRGTNGGDHLHLDMATVPYTREYLDSGVPFVDPVPVLKAHLDPLIVDAMLRRGDK